MLRTASMSDCHREDGGVCDESPPNISGQHPGPGLRLWVCPGPCVRPWGANICPRAVPPLFHHPCGHAQLLPWKAARPHSCCSVLQARVGGEMAAFAHWWTKPEYPPGVCSQSLLLPGWCQPELSTDLAVAVWAWLVLRPGL